MGSVFGQLKVGGASIFRAISATTNPGEPSLGVTGIVITPALPIIAAGGTLQLHAEVQGPDSPSQAGSWVKLDGAGSINPVSGVVTAPSTSAIQVGNFSFTSLQDPSYSARVLVIFLALPVPVYYPPENQVQLGVHYGPTGVEFTGTYVPLGALATAEAIAKAVWEYQEALNIPNFLAISDR